MNRPAFLPVALALALIAGPRVLGQVADEAAVPRITVAELKKAADANRVLVIDVRDAGSYADGHIPGAVNLPLDELKKRLPALKDARTPIVAYCA